MVTHCACAARYHPAGKDRRFSSVGLSLGGTGVVLLLERCSSKALHNNSRCSALICSNIPRRSLCRVASVNFALQSHCHSRGCIELAHRFRTLCCYRDADFLRARRSQPMVHFCLRYRVRSGFCLWLSAGRVALRRRGSCLVSGGAPPLVVCPGRVTFIAEILVV